MAYRRLSQVTTASYTVEESLLLPLPCITRNSSGDEIANVNFLYDDIVHALKIQ